MATTYKGSSGVVKVGTTDMAEVRDWSLTISMDTTEDTVMGDTFRTYKTTLGSASGSINCYWADDDATGQDALSIAKEIESSGDGQLSVTLKLYAHEGAGGDFYTMTALITEESASAAFDGMVERTYSFQATGPVQTDTVA